MLVRIRDLEACDAADQTFAWDTVWYNRLDAQGGYGDWILAGADDPPEQHGGMRARMALDTAILLQVFSDKRLPEGMRPPGSVEYPRGWWGDSIRLVGEPEAVMGSLLWTLERGSLDDDTARTAKDYVDEALQVILDQGAVARFETTARADKVRGRLTISIAAFNRAGQRINSNNVFDVVWAQVAHPAPMNFSAR